jgi:hypothetical protein
LAELRVAVFFLVLRDFELLLAINCLLVGVVDLRRFARTPSAVRKRLLPASVVSACARSLLCLSAQFSRLPCCSIRATTSLYVRESHGAQYRLAQHFA